MKQDHGSLRCLRTGALVLSFIATALCPAILAGGEIVPPAAGRFADPEVQESPDFQRHVIPLLGRLGCNGRSCHGSFQGQGGFQLSLFGYDFKTDHQALTKHKGDTGVVRVSVPSPSQSLILKKALELVEHEGGQKIKPGSWQSRLLLNWIRSGAPAANVERKLDRLEISPSEALFHSIDESLPLRVIAVWADGGKEDVTCLSRFRVNDDSVATVGKDGVIRAGEPGDTHVVAFYDNGVAAIPVIRPVDRPQTDTLETARTDIDRLIGDKLHKLGISPSPLCADQEFLRRISLDLTGTLPVPNEVEAFLSDSSPDKRQRKIDDLLERPAYAAWWANKLCDYTGNNPRQQSDVGQELAVQWYRWIYVRLRQNMPYDELAASIVLATGREPDSSYLDYAREMSSYLRVDNPADFGKRATMPHYWARRSLATPADKALAFAHSFLGVQLQCAQCHKHPFDQWSKADFEQFTEFFEPIRYGVAPDGMEQHQRMARANNARMKGGMMMGVGADMLGRAETGEVVPWREVYVRQSGTTNKQVSLLGMKRVGLGAKTDPRRHLMDWMREPGNAYFARAFVNRVWANYFGVGIIDPPDDLNQANPPSNKELLNYLESGFIKGGYDMKWLHREIVSSDAYQRSWRPNSSNEGDRRNFSRMLPRRIPAEVLYDALAQITAADSEELTVRTNLERRAIGHLSMRMAGTYAMNIFGKPDRATNCDCERSGAISLLQPLFLKNDPITRNRLRDSGWLDAIDRRFGQSAPGPDARKSLIRQAYLRCLGRHPSPREFERVDRHLKDSASAREGMEDALWALANTKEFLMNH